MEYDRTIVAYHGCDQKVARALLRGAKLKASDNDYDWLGRGIYFWEYGADRAFRFATEQVARGKLEKPAVVGALVQLGRCFDLMDTRFTRDLAEAFDAWKLHMERAGLPLPTNAGASPDHKLRRLDCAMLNWYLDLAEKTGMVYDTVRCGFVEGGPAFSGSGIHRESHVQLAVRNPACVVGVFRPTIGLR
ncbi:MAG: hypothetical protein HYV07_14040 [Deltaproteobacteria bacterium]|nr:hypothetical protein [Deltaproteobacteria bacterium]